MAMRDLMNSTALGTAGICYAPDGDGASPPGPQPVPPQPPFTPTPPREAPVRHDERTRDEEIANLRAEAAQQRINARQAREDAEVALASVQEVRDAAARQVEEAEARLASVNQKIKNRTAQEALRAQAVAAGIVDEDLLPLIDRAAVAVDDEGNVTGAAEAVAAFKAKKPEFFRTAQQGPSNISGETPRPQRSGGFNAPAPNPNPPPASVTTLEPAAYNDRKREAAVALSHRR